MQEAGGRLLLMRGRGIQGSLVRWYTRSAFAHCAFLYPDGRTIIESCAGYGVRQTAIKSWDGITVCDIPGMTVLQWQKLFYWVEDKLGDKYDWSSILTFLTRNKPNQNNRWFCSELCHAALNAVDSQVLVRVKSSKVYPGLLSYSPLITVSAWQPK